MTTLTDQTPGATPTGMATPFFSRTRPPLTYGITPPKRATTAERRAEIAERQATRIASLPIDALVVYDLQDESSRTDAERPFPFVACVDPSDYAFGDLAAVRCPKVVYRGVAASAQDELAAFLSRVADERGAAVLVGAPSRTAPVRLGLREAYALAASHPSRVAIGGVTIAERHARSYDEHLRILAKVDAGCSFVISQAVYSVTASKDLLSDLAYRCREDGREPPVVIVTLSPCGSARTLAFMRWLGVTVPRWLENELLHAEDTLRASVEVSLAAFEELRAFANAKGVPLGCNVESVSLGLAEIDASVEMVHRVAGLMDGR